MQADQNLQVTVSYHCSNCARVSEAPVVDSPMANVPAPKEAEKKIFKRNRLTNEQRSFILSYIKLYPIMMKNNFLSGGIWNDLSRKLVYQYIPWTGKSLRTCMKSWKRSLNHKVKKVGLSRLNDLETEAYNVFYNDDPY